VTAEGPTNQPEDDRGPVEGVWESVESQVQEWEAQVREANERIDKLRAGHSGQQSWWGLDWAGSFLPLSSSTR
jgi:hypothetical protein